MSITLQVGAGRYPVTPQLVDSATKVPIPNSTYSFVSATSDNTAVCVVDASGAPKGLAAGVANLTYIFSWNYTDQKTGLAVTNQQETTVVAATVAVTPQGVLQIISFGNPIP